MERLTQRLRTGEVLMASNCEEKYTEQEWICVLQDRLAAYENSGCDPEEVLPKDKSDEIALKLMRLADLENLCSYTRLRELAEADKGDRVVVLPCQSGERVFAILDGEKHVRECEVGHAVLDDWRKVFAIRPVGYAQNAYYAPFGAFGRTVFLTREEAEKALEAMRKEEAP